MTAVENSYQNPDVFQENPLNTGPVSTSNDSLKPTKKFRFPTDPKIRLLVVLAAIIVLLLPLSLVSSFLRQQKTSSVTPTPVISSAPSPSPTSVIAIPDELQTKINSIQKLSTSPDTVSPPQIDEEIGIVSD